jgi:uncharacterized phiE125 gp8 family phage protein
MQITIPAATPPPSELPVPLSTVKHHCKLTGTDEDAYLTLLIKAAARTIERDTRLALLPRSETITTVYDPCSGRIAIPRGPFLSLTSVTLHHSDGSTSAGDPEDWQHNGKLPGTLSPADDYSPPAGKITIVYRAGSDPLPEDLQLLLMMLVAHWYEHKEAATADGTVNETPLSYRHLVRAMDPMTDAVR